MALTVNFSCSQVAGESDEIVFTDLSTGSDGTITQRRIYIQAPDGTYLVEDGTTTEYETWDDYPATTTITLDVLDKDYATTITVQWLAGTTVVYDKQLIYGFTLYNETFDYGLTQRLAGNPSLINDNNFWSNKLDLRVSIDSGNQALELASDVLAAQLCYDRATELRTDAQYLFNGNS